MSGVAIERPVCGGLHTLAVPLDGLREVARVEPRLVVLLRRLVEQQATLQEVETVLGVAIKYGRAGVTAEQVIRQEGFARAMALAFEALQAAVLPPEGADPGEPGAGAEDAAPARQTATTTGST